MATHSSILSWRISMDIGVWWAAFMGSQRVPWTERSSHSILKEINPDYSLEGLMLKLKLQYFWPPDAKNWLTGKDPDAGKDRRQEEKGMTEDEMVGWHHWLNGLVLEQLRELVKDREAWCAVVHVVAKSQTWTTYKWLGGLSHCLMNNDVRAFINTIYFPILLEQAFISLLLTDQSVKHFSNALACFF